MTAIRRCAIGILYSHKSEGTSIAELMRPLLSNTRLVFDYLKMTKNTMNALSA